MSNFRTAEHIINQSVVGVDPQIASGLKGHFVVLSLSQFGCHVVQKVSKDRYGKGESQAQT